MNIHEGLKSEFMHIYIWASTRENLSSGGLRTTKAKTRLNLPQAKFQFSS